MANISLSDLDPIVKEASEKFGVPVDYIWNVIRAENSGSVEGAQSLKAAPTNAVSPKNARGVMQMTPIALKDVTEAGLVPAGIDHRNMSVRDQILTGAAYLSRLLKLSQKPEEVYAMYNYGPKARFRMDQLPEETSTYVKKATGTQMADNTSSTSKSGALFDTGKLVDMLLNITTTQNANIQKGQAESEVQMARSRDVAAQGFDQMRTAIDQQEVTSQGVADVKFKVADTVQKLQSLFGMNPEQTNNEIANSLAQIDAARTARAPVRAEYDKLASTDLLTNPIGYIFAQLKLPSVAAKNNALADQEDVAIKNIQQRTAMLANAKSTITANTADELRELEKQQATIDAEKARAQLTITEAGNIAGSAQSRMQAMQVANMIGDNTRNTLLGIANLQDREEQFTFRQEERTRILEGKKLADEEKLRFNNRAKIVSDALGLVEPMTHDRLRQLTSKAQQEAWLRAITNDGPFGANLEDSLEFFRNANVARLRQTGGASSVTTAEKLQNAGVTYQATIERMAMATGGKKLSPKEARAKAFEVYSAEVESSTAGAGDQPDLSNSKWDQVYNPYVAPFVGFNKAIDTAPQLAGLRNNEVTKTIRDLIVSGAVTKENLTADQQKQVLLAVSEKVNSRAISPKKAAEDIANYFKAATAYNQALNKYDLFALAPQKSYVFTLPSDSFKDNKKKVDLMNPQLVEQVLVWRAQQSYFGAGIGAILNPFNIPGQLANRMQEKAAKEGNK